MPIITIEGPKASKEQKKELIEKITKVASECYNLPEQAITISIYENPMDNVGVGGKQLSYMH